MFNDDETPEQLTVSVSEKLSGYMTRNRIMSIDMAVNGNQIALRSQSGSTLSITCNGQKEFRLEEDAFPTGGARNQPRRWAGNRQTAEELDRNVKTWLAEQSHVAAH